MGLRWLLPVAAAVALLAPAEATAWKRSLVQGTQVCLFWEERELPWVLNEDGAPGLELEAVQQALRDSFAAWEGVECTDVRFIEQGLTSARAVGYDNDGGATNLIVFRDELCEEVVEAGDPCWDDFSCGNEYGCWPFSSGVIAVTTTSYREDTGQIVDADIEFNAASFRFTTSDRRPCARGETEDCVSTDLANTATHEIGHVLGIDHSEVMGSTMFASAPLGETSKRTLSSDDIDAVCTIYPIGEPANVCEHAYGLRRPDDGDGGCGGCASSGTGAGLAWVVALGCLIRFRSRGR